MQNCKFENSNPGFMGSVRTVKFPGPYIYMHYFGENTWIQENWYLIDLFEKIHNLPRWYM